LELRFTGGIMVVLEVTDIKTVAGGPTDGPEPVEQYRVTDELSHEVGSVPNTTSYLKLLAEPSRGFRIDGWRSYREYVDAFADLLIHGDLAQWTTVIQNLESQIYELDPRDLPFDASVIGLVRFYSQSDCVDDCDAYFKKLKEELKAHAPGARAFGAWNCNDENEPDKFLLVVGWESEKQHHSFFTAGYPTNIVKQVNCIDRVEIALTKNIEFGLEKK
jgi:heme-degrading monooxygenase HmoA